MGTVAACECFAAVCGASTATAATISRVAMPSMRRLGYHDRLSTGAVAAGGTLGILIPRPVRAVIYGLLSETDIARMFVAGILPGLILAALFVAVIAILCGAKPEAGPRGPIVPMRDRICALGRVRGILVLFALVIGGLCSGMFAPTEAVGVFAAGALAVTRSKPTFGDYWSGVVETGITTGMIFVVAMGALIFSRL